MPDTATETPAPETSDDAVMAAALAADRGETADVTPETQTPETDTATSPETNGKPSETGGEDGSTTSEEGDPQKKAEAAGNKPGDDKATKPESAFAKAQKEKARFEGVRKKFHEEQAALRAEKAKFEAERAEFERTRTQTPVTKPAADEPQGPNADAFERAAKQYEEEGNSSMAQLAREKATELRAKEAQRTTAAPAATQQPGSAMNDPKFKQEWLSHTAELVKADPTLNDPNNPIVQQTNAYLKDPTYGRYFRAFPDGIKMAHQVAVLNAAAQRVPKLEGELKTAKAEIDRLTKLTGLRGAPPPSGTPGAPRALDGLSGEAADDFVMQQALRADRGEST
jgi:hypothetical protein